MTLPESAPTLADIRAARGAITGLALRTPTIAATALSALAGQEILLKLESLQPVGAFKLRGAVNASLPASHAVLWGDVRGGNPRGGIAQPATAQA